MGAFIVKQPNGLYCRFSSVVNCPTHWNMTEEDYVEYCAERAREEARRMIKEIRHPFSDVIENFIPGEMTLEEFNKFLEETREYRRNKHERSTESKEIQERIRQASFVTY